VRQVSSWHHGEVRVSRQPAGEETVAHCREKSGYRIATPVVFLGVENIGKRIKKLIDLVEERNADTRNSTADRATSIRFQHKFQATVGDISPDCTSYWLTRLVLASYSSRFGSALTVTNQISPSVSVIIFSPNI